MMNKLKKTMPGVLLSLAIALPAWFLGKQIPLIGGPVFGIIAGMLVGNLGRTSRKQQEGIRYTSKKILQYSIILLGFEMNLFNVIRVGGQSLFIMLFTLSTAFVTAFVMGRVLKLEGKMTTLIGVGTSICGGSAIAATAPVIDARDEEVAHAISTIFLFNILAVFLFPLAGHVLGLSDIGFGMWAGTAINDTSSVVAAGAAWSDQALSFATIVKLTRTLMIVPITLVLAVYTARKESGSSTGGRFRIAKVFPWFVIGFVAAAILNTFLGVPAVSGTLAAAGKFMIVMAMAAIGLNTDLKKLIKNGLKPIVLGLCCWFAVAGVSLVVQHYLGIW